MTVEIVEVIRRSDQGVTLPFICRGDDGDIYFVKGRGAGRRSQIAEWIAGNLGRRLGLPIAPFSIVEIPEELIELDNTLDLTDLGAGPAFGSRRHTLTELSYSLIHEVPYQLQCDVLGFDWWIRNADRILTENGGNPNLFWAPAENELIILDHNQAFERDFDKQNFVEYHVFSDSCRGLFSDWELRNGYSEKFHEALKGWNDICDTIPNEWWFADPEMTVPADFDKDAELALLRLCETEEFWNIP